jgi:hypothetical protein
LLKKEAQDFGSKYISNCVTLATWARIEFLTAMAKKFMSDREDKFVMDYDSRPVLQVKPKEGGPSSLLLWFSVALVSYCSGLIESDLGGAVRKAGVAFRGQLEQNFVALHNKIEKPSNGQII